MTDENYWLTTNIETINTSIDELLDKVNDLRNKKKELQEQLSSEQSAQGGFKVGDKVTTDGLKKGTVIQILTLKDYLVRIRLDESGDIRQYHNTRLTLTEPTLSETLTPKFKLYDYVEYKKCKHQIIAVLPPHENDHLFGFKGGIVYKYHIGGSGGVVSEDALSPWEDEPTATKPKFDIDLDIKLDTGWFFISDVHKMLRKETSRQLGIPDSINSEYRTSEAPEKVNYCHVWFEMDDTVYSYYLNSKLSDDKFTVLSYLPERRLTDE